MFIILHLALWYLPRLITLILATLADYLLAWPHLCFFINCELGLFQYLDNSWSGTSSQCRQCSDTTRPTEKSHFDAFVKQIRWTGGQQYTCLHLARTMWFPSHQGSIRCPSILNGCPWFETPDLNVWFSTCEKFVCLKRPGARVQIYKIKYALRIFV